MQKITISQKAFDRKRNWRMPKKGRVSKHQREILPQ